MGASTRSARGTKLLRVLAFSVAILAVGALVFAWSGLYNIGASQGHWGIARGILALAMRSSVETHAGNIEPPRLDDLALVMRGAGHYEGGCAPCHGAPGRPRNPIPTRMLPEPPYLTDAEKWKPNELFWIVKHGIKYAGMPGWVALERDDEVWALVAFLRRLPGMSAEEYRRLAFGPLASVVPGLAENKRLLAIAGPIGGSLTACARCHGVDGEGRGVGAFPRLSIQTAPYLYEALKSYSVGSRRSGIMQPVAVELKDEDMRALAEYYAELGGRSELPPAAQGEGLATELGAALAHRGEAQAGVVACETCHGPSRDPSLPALAGQYADFLEIQLRLFKAGIRGGPNAVVMSSIARQLTDRQIEAVARYYASLRPQAREQ